MRTFKIYSLSNFQRCNAVFWGVVTGSLCLSTSLLTFPTPHHTRLLATTNLFSVYELELLCYFCCCVSFFFWDITYKGENMVFVLLRLFHLAWCPLSILLSQMARFLSFYVWITLHYMSVHIHMCMRARTHTHTHTTSSLNIHSSVYT